MKNVFLASLILSLVFSCAEPSCQDCSADPTSHLRTLGESDVAFGESQLEAMIHDRPKMLEFAKKGDPIWTWAARQFAGEYTGARYYWNGDPHFKRSQCSMAIHHVPFGNDVGFVTVYNFDEDGYICSPERMWAAVIFELFNMRNDDEFRELGSRAKQLSKAEFIRGFLQCEYKALQQLGPFYKNVVEPTRNESQGRTGWYWYLDLKPTFDQWFASKRNTPYFDYYGYMYDDVITGRLW